METNIGTIIDDIVRENKIYRFASELQYTENNERKEILREILKKLHNDTNDKSEKAREEITKICVKINENQMKKKWFRLAQEQKIEQIEKYYADKEDGEKEKKVVIDLLKKEKLENKHVEYDDKNGKIINIIFEKEKKTKLKKKDKKKTKEESSSSDSD